MVLCKNDLHALLVALDLSKQTMARIHLNYFWALAYNACLIPIAAGVLYPGYHFALAPMLAGAAMALSSVSIVLSSLLLVRYQPPRQLDDTKAISGHNQRVLAEGSCDCPASSAPELVDDIPTSPVMRIWAALTGTRAVHLTDASELLTPAEWRAEALSKENHSFVRMQVERALDDHDHDDYSNQDGQGKSVWSPMSFVGQKRVGLRSGLGSGVREGYAPVMADEEESGFGIGDIELRDAAGMIKINSEAHHTKSSRVSAPANTSAKVKVKVGCGCGKGNCRCGSGCRCGEATSPKKRI